MAIIPIPNQPIDLQQTSADACNLGDGKEYCTLYNNGDYLYWQGKQTPCGNDLMCSPKFGTNILLNSDFALTLENWSISDSWYWSTNGASVVASGVSQIWQNVPSMVAGQSYSITFTVVNFSAGTIRCVLGGGTAGTYRSANGTYTETIVAGSADQNIRFDCGGGGFSGSIVDIIFTGDTSCAANNDSWIVGDQACNIPNVFAPSLLYIPFTPVESTGYYQFTIHVKSMTAGSLQVYDSALSNYYGTITSNGDYTYYGVLAGNEIDLVADILFDGCLSEINIYELRRDIQIHLTDINGTIIEDISANVTYVKDRLILKYDTQFLPVAGCYRIAIEDLCDLDTSGLITEYNSDSGFDSAGSWTTDVSSVNGVPPPDATMSIAASKLSLVSVGANLGAGVGYINKTWATGNNYYIFKIRFETATIDSATELYIGLPNIDSGGMDFYPMPPTFYISNKTYTYNLVARVKSTAGCVYSGVNVHNKLGILIQGYLTNQLKSFSVKGALLDTSTIPYLSNCFSMVTTHDCAKLVEGWENAPDDNGVYRLGFLFPDTTGTAFRLSQRLRQIKFNPTYPTEGEDYQYSDGSRKNTFMQREKYNDCLYDYMDETALDALTAEAMCEQFQIDGVDYFAKQEDFKPEWNKDGSQRLAQMRMLIRKKISTIFNSKV